MSAKEVASLLLENKAVYLRPNDPFTWASGIKSPIYCDNRFMLSFPQARTKIVNDFCELINRDYSDCEVIMGTATAGIPWAALIASQLGLPMGYVRSSNKDHGKQNKIEGKIEKGQKVLVIEDLISTGGSVKGTVEALREVGCEVQAVVAIFSYLLEDANKQFADLKCELQTLSNYDVLTKIALEENYIETSDLAKLVAWKKNPHDESWIEK